MAELCGKKIVCDRCGEEVFLRYIGEKEFDGGWTKMQYFEPFPEDWTNTPMMQRNGKYITYHLCPKCSDEYDRLIWGGFLAEEDKDEHRHDEDSQD